MPFHVLKTKLFIRVKTTAAKGACSPTSVHVLIDYSEVCYSVLNTSVASIHVISLYSSSGNRLCCFKGEQWFVMICVWPGHIVFLLAVNAQGYLWDGVGLSGQSNGITSRRPSERGQLPQKWSEPIHKIDWNTPNNTNKQGQNVLLKTMLKWDLVLYVQRYGSILIFGLSNKYCLVLFNSCDCCTQTSV